MKSEEGHVTSTGSLLGDVTRVYDVHNWKAFERTEVCSLHGDLRLAHSKLQTGLKGIHESAAVFRVAGAHTEQHSVSCLQRQLPPQKQQQQAR